MATPQKIVLVTAAGLKKLEEELEHLKTAGRKEVANQLSEAISYGDLSENAEYDEAKNRQAQIEVRIMELEEQLKYVEIISEEKIEKGVIQIGSTVVIRRAGEKQEHEYSIVGSTEANPIMHKISNESPVGEALLGKKVKEKVVVAAPGGNFTYEVLKVK